MQVKYWTFILPSFLFIACTANNESSLETFKSDTTLIRDDYPMLVEDVIPIMEKLEMCTTNDTVTLLPPCSNKYFQVFKYRPDRNWSEGFIVEMIPGIFGAPVHQVVIVESYFGKYQIINQYFGHLLEMRTTISGYNNLVIGYNDPDIGLVAIRHEWQGAKYDVVDVEEINNHYVKAEFKDSINNIFLPAFSAGH